MLDIASYARHGPGRQDRLSPAEVALIARTVHHAPEVMVKVLTKGSTDRGSVARHIGYLGRYGELAIETDEGERLEGKAAAEGLLNAWDLDIEELTPGADVGPRRGRSPPRLVHKLLLSMPPGTPSAAVLAAARTFLREEFGLKHRYAFVLHTDEPHPHVHAVVKAVSEQGLRPHINKATLRFWRQDFARHLRAQGVEANATERSVRGQSKMPKLDPIYRAAQRGRSWHMAERAFDAVRELMAGPQRSEEASKLLQTRSKIVRGWQAMREILVEEDRHQLAGEVGRFVNQMDPPRSDGGWLAHELFERARQPVAKDKPLIR